MVKLFLKKVVVKLFLKKVVVKLFFKKVALKEAELTKFRFVDKKLKNVSFKLI